MSENEKMKKKNTWLFSWK